MDTNPNLHVTPPADGWAVERQWPRYSIDVRVVLTVRTSMGTTYTCYARGTDLSANGMSIYTPMKIVLGHEVQLVLTIPYCERPIEIKAVIRHQDESRIGVEFTGMGALEREALAETLASLDLVH